MAESFMLNTYLLDGRILYVKYLTLPHEATHNLASTAFQRYNNLSINLLKTILDCCYEQNLGGVGWDGLTEPICKAAVKSRECLASGTVREVGFSIVCAACIHTLSSFVLLCMGIF